ncbi:MAG: phenylacetate--CoA ligase [Oscillospiraceae bacterium]|nr:phenylacetate--CoA ligase [Oscillospiraceae bacterium]
MFFQKDIETMPRQKIEELQLERLRHLVKFCIDNVPFYAKRLSDAGVTPEKIKSLKDIENIPYTTKEDIRDSYPFGLFGQPLKKIVRLHASSGTTGKPTVVGYTKKDLDIWSDCVARIVMAAGATEDDVIQISFNYGLFTGALGLHYGLEKVGATVVPTSSGNTAKQIMLMQDFKTTGLVSTPSYAQHIAELIEETGVKENIHLKLGLFGSEGCTEGFRDRIEESFSNSHNKFFATDNYGMSELMGPGVSGDCIYRTGMHINEDHFLAEVIDSKTLEVLPRGSQGELVITTLTKEGIPMLRYRTKDITQISYDGCQCGRTTARMSKIKGRSDDMLKIRGVNVFPSQIESVLVTFTQISPNYQLVLTRTHSTDELEVKVELADGSLLEKFTELDVLKTNIKKSLKSTLEISCKVSLVEHKSMERTGGKAQRIVDLRDEVK